MTAAERAWKFHWLTGPEFQGVPLRAGQSEASAIARESPPHPLRGLRKAHSSPLEPRYRRRQDRLEVSIQKVICLDNLVRLCSQPPTASARSPSNPVSYTHLTLPTKRIV